MLLKTLVLSLYLTHLVQPAPVNDKALFEDGPEDRRRKRPCRGRSEDGRTFLDWSFQYVDVNYNYNYNINCGGGGDKPGLGGGGNKPILGGGGGNKPILGGGGGHHQGGGLFGGGGQHQGGGLFGGGGQHQGGGLLGGGSGPASGGNHQGGGGLFGGGNRPIQFIQTQAQTLFADGGLLSPQNIGSIVPQVGGWFNDLGSFFQGGLFNGQGIGSLFDGGLFSGIFGNRPPSNPSPPAPPPPASIHEVVTTPKPPAVDPSDIIYSDEKPVHEDHDDVVPDAYSNYRPARYPNRHREYQNYRSNSIRFQ